MLDFTVDCFCDIVFGAVVITVELFCIVFVTELEDTVDVCFVMALTWVFEFCVGVTTGAKSVVAALLEAMALDCFSDE